MSTHSFLHHLKHVQETYEKETKEIIQTLDNEYKQFTANFNDAKATSKNDLMYLKSAIENMFEVCTTDHQLLLETKCLENDTLTFYEFFNTKILSSNNHNYKEGEQIIELLNPVGREKLNIIKQTIDEIKNENINKFHNDNNNGTNRNDTQKETKEAGAHTIFWPPQDNVSQFMVQVYNGDKHATRLSLNHCIESIYDFLTFYYHFDPDVSIEILIENTGGYVKISNLFSNVLRGNSVIGNILFKKLLTSSSSTNSTVGNNNFSIGGSSLIDVYILDSNLVSKDTVDVELAYKNHSALIHRLKVPITGTTLRHIREMIFGITLKHDEGEGNDAGEDSDSDNDSDNDSIDNSENDTHNVMKYKYQIFSKLNQKESYQFVHQGMNIPHAMEINKSAIQIAIDEGCLDTYNGVVQSEDLILLINDE
jgi:hypothetical protein